MTSGASKTIGRLTLLASLAAAAAAQAQTPPGAPAAKPPVIARAEACLRQKVDRVVADEPDIAAAANFLVSYACADEVAGATRFLRNTAYVELFSAAFKAGAAAAAAAKPPAQSQGQTTGGANPAAAAAMAGALMSQLKVDPETGDVTAGPQATQINAALGQFSNIMGQFLPDNVPVPLRKLAGDLVLEARERHRAK
ncbi:hypothetical protein [Phenylobacterium sp.]|uniref:hypothetical protein n=1 Tax=Phenylobacterium sp. TaxID=1871053 RepID=UPI001200BF2B|nr:hypothetical protein [Phenylobacterium sp.]THD61051.1 MAG: hypothetical protein E8A49_12355 [Phenylobacterium sp.]